MKGIRLKTVFRPLGHTEALRDGTVKPKSFQIEYQDIPVLIQAFRRMVRGSEFDVCELAFTTYLCAKAHRKPFTAIPVFPARVFHHGAILVNTKAGIRHPKDLKARLLACAGATPSRPVCGHAASCSMSTAWT